MSLTPDDFAPLIERNGPVEVVDQQGKGIAHAPSGMFQAIEPPLPEVWSAHDAKLVLFDEQTRPVRDIPAAHIVSVRRVPPGARVIVDDTIDVEPGDSLSTRG